VKLHLKTAVSAALLATSMLTATPVQQRATLTPMETKVAILPILNTSGEKWVDLRNRQVSAATEFLNKEFRSRGFDVLTSESVAAALTGLNLDLSDEENWKRENLYKLGEAVGARLVYMVVITGTAQHKSTSFFSVTVEGSVDLKMWLLDVGQRQSILSAKTVRGSSKHDDVFGALKGSDLQVVAVSNGLRDGLKEFFAPYPAKTVEKPKPGTGG
jgi:hypothetical protein